MSTAALCALMLTVGVDYGYEPIEGTDGIRYVILIEPTMLNALRDGTPIGSMVVPEVRGRIQAFQIVTSGKLSKEIPPSSEPSQPPASLKLPAPAESTVPREAPLLPIEASSLAEPSWPPLTSLGPSVPNLLPEDDRVIPTSAQENLSLDGPSGVVDTSDPELPELSDSEPWFLLPLASLVAVGSSIGMLFFGWLTFDYRSRYLELLRDSVDSSTSWLETPVNEPDPDPLLAEDTTSATYSNQSSEEQIDTAASEDSAWRDLGADTEDGLDDWLNEENDRDRRSRRKRKKSR